VQKEELASKRPLVPVDVELPENEQEVLATFRVAAALGRQALGAYVISMASRKRPACRPPPPAGARCTAPLLGNPALRQ
jgi:Phosphoenolpyruvate carboxylase